MGRIAILSGRYEIVHPGHIKTIRREAKRFDILYVYVVDNKESPTPPIWNVELIEYCVADLQNVKVVLHRYHFGFVIKHDLKNLPKHDVFLSANPSVTEHLRSLGESVEEIEPTLGYSSTEIKNGVIRQSNSK